MALPRRKFTLCASILRHLRRDRTSCPRTSQTIAIPIAVAINATLRGVAAAGRSTMSETTRFMTSGNSAYSALSIVEHLHLARDGAEREKASRCSPT